MLRQPSMYYESPSIQQTNQISDHLEPPIKRPFLRRRAGLIKLLNRIETNQAIVRSSNIPSSSQTHFYDNSRSSLNRSGVYKRSSHFKDKNNYYGQSQNKVGTNLRVQTSSNFIVNENPKGSQYDYKSINSESPSYLPHYDPSIHHDRLIDFQAHNSFLSKPMDSFSNFNGDWKREDCTYSKGFMSTLRNRISSYRFNNTPTKPDLWRSYLKPTRKIDKNSIYEKNNFKKRSSVMPFMRGPSEKYKPFTTDFSNMFQHFNTNNKPANSFAFDVNLGKETHSSSTIENSKSSILNTNSNLATNSPFITAKQSPDMIYNSSPETSASSKISNKSILKDLEVPKQETGNSNSNKQNNTYKAAQIEHDYQAKRKKFPFVFSIILILIILRISLHIHGRSMDKVI